MRPIEIEKLLKSGVHFGHLTRKWNPAMAPYIFMERNGIHIIDLKKRQPNSTKVVRPWLSLQPVEKRSSLSPPKNRQRKPWRSK